MWTDKTQLPPGDDPKVPKVNTHANARTRAALISIDDAGLLPCVLAHLSTTHDLVHASAVSRGWRAAALTEHLWRSLCEPYPMLKLLKARQGGARTRRTLLIQRLMAIRKEDTGPCKSGAKPADFCMGIELRLLNWTSSGECNIGIRNCATSKPRKVSSAPRCKTDLNRRL